MKLFGVTDLLFMLTMVVTVRFLSKLEELYIKGEISLYVNYTIRKQEQNPTTGISSQTCQNLSLTFYLLVTRCFPALKPSRSSKDYRRFLKYCLAFNLLHSMKTSLRYTILLPSTIALTKFSSETEVFTPPTYILLPTLNYSFFSLDILSTLPEIPFFLSPFLQPFCMCSIRGKKQTNRINSYKISGEVELHQKIKIYRCNKIKM